MAKRPMIPEIAAELRRQDASLRKFKRALLGGNVDALSDACADIDAEYIWPRAWKRVINIKQELSDDVKRFFVSVWFQFGEHLRQEAADDLLFIDALRKIMPPYKGRDMTLYRGETASNRDHHTYGPCWDAQRYVARQHAERGFCRQSEGGSRLLQAKVPASAIITHIGSYRPNSAEDEYLIDRRGLPENAVRCVEAFAQLKPATARADDRI